MARFKFRVRFGFRGNRISIINSSSVVNARKAFKRRHPRAKIDSIELVTRRRK